MTDLRQQPASTLPLQKLDIPIISNDDCKEDRSYGKALLNDMFCAGFMEGGKVEKREILKLTIDNLY